MWVQCAWCGLELGEQEPLADRRITHGMCESCSRSHLATEPELVVDEETRIVARNPAPGSLKH